MAEKTLTNTISLDDDDIPEIEVEDILGDEVEEEEKPTGDDGDAEEEAEEEAEDGDETKAEEGDGDDDEEGDDDKLADRTKKRLRKAFAEREAAERRAEEAERKLAESERQNKTERVGRAEATATATVAELESEEKEIRSQLRAAKESGDTDKEMELQDKWTDLKVDLKSARAAQSRFERERKAADEGDDGEQDKGAQRQQKAQEVPERFQKWLSRNKWLNDPEYAAEKAAAMTIEMSLRRNGYDMKSPDFYRELDKRLGQSQARIAKLHKESRAYVGTGTVATGTSSGAAPSGFIKKSNGKLVYKFTKTDHDRMREFGLDPTKEIDKQEWARSRARTIQESNARKRA